MIDDAENRLYSMDSGAWTFVYDALGRRLRKTNGSTNYDVIYDLAGHVQRSLSNGTTPAHATEFFTGDEHDSESNTEHTLFRQLSRTQGRWLTPDPYMGSMDLGNPQSLNRYAYVLNNPLNAIDPDGRECVWDDGSYDSANAPDTGDSTSCGEEGGTWVGHEQFVGMPDWSPNAGTYNPYLNDVPGRIIIPTLEPTVPGVVAGNVGDAKKAEEKKCLDDINKSPEGKMMKFFSLAELVTNAQEVWKEWLLLPPLKIAAVKVVQAASELGNVEFLSVTGGISTVVTAPAATAIKASEAAIGPVVPFAIGGATAVDIASRIQCHFDPSLPANGIPIAPK